MGLIERDSCAGVLGDSAVNAGIKEGWAFACSGSSSIWLGAMMAPVVSFFGSVTGGAGMVSFESTNGAAGISSSGGQRTRRMTMVVSEKSCATTSSPTESSAWLFASRACTSRII